MLVESGDFVSGDKPRTQAAVTVARNKAELLFRAYRAMGYDAVLPGEADFVAGIRVLTDQAKAGFPLVCLNVVSAGTGKPFFPPYRRFVRAGARILVTGLIDARFFPKGALSGLGLAVLPPVEALAALLHGPAGRADVVIVLSHLDSRGDRELARNADRPLLILGSHSRAPLRAAEPASGSILSVPRDRGMALSEIVVGPPRGAGVGPPAFVDASSPRGTGWAEAGPARRVSLRTLRLDPTIPDDPDVRAMVRAFREAPGRRAEGGGPASPGRTAFVGHTACARCHPVHHAEWRRRPHAWAFGRLADQGDGGNPDCLACHLTGGAESASGPEAEDEGVGCESCHGPGTGHPGRRMAIPGASACRSCHRGPEPFPFAEKRRMLGCSRASAE